MKHEAFRQKFGSVLPTDDAVMVLEAVEKWLIERESEQLHKPDVVRSLPGAEEILQATDKLVESSRLTGKRHKEAIRFGFANGVDWMKKRSGQ